MLSLDRRLAAIERGELGEAAVYADERAYRLPRGRVAPGGLHCPICGLRAGRFLRFGLAGRRNARCPRCGSVERHRFLWLYLAQHSGLLARRLSVVHTAPEPCLEARLRALPHWRYLSVDRFSPVADLAADLTALPLPDSSADLLITSHVLEHIPEDERAIAEIARVLKPGGRALILVPLDVRRPVTEEGRDVASPAERMARFGHPFHFRIYGRDLLDRLAAAGLAPRLVDTRRLLSPHRRRLFRINRNYMIDARRTAR